VPIPLRALRLRFADYLSQAGDTRTSKKVERLKKVNAGGGLLSSSRPSHQIRELPAAGRRHVHFEKLRKVERLERGHRAADFLFETFASDAGTTSTLPQAGDTRVLRS
jgi:hypothetical protein